MKRIVLIVLAVIFNINISKAQYDNYFSENILNLDPIEGVWVWDFSGVSTFTFHNRRDTNRDNGKCSIKRTGNNTFKSSDNRLQITRIGETNVYNIIRTNSAGITFKHQVALENNGYYFTLRYDDARTHLGETMTVSWVENYVKEYPTSSMYISALEKKREEEFMALEAKRKAEEAARTKEWTGTGFALKDGYIVTNHHVIDGAKSIEIYGVNGNFSTPYRAIVEGSDKNNDLAILKISDSRFNGFGNIPYAVKTTMAEVGEDVFVLGYPLTQVMGNEIKLTNGIISSRSGFQGDISTYQISAPVQPGNSGGPLFDSKGNVIGIVNAGIPGADNVGYAIKTSYLRNLVENVTSTNILPTNNQISTLSLPQKVSKEKNFVFFIMCSGKSK